MHVAAGAQVQVLAMVDDGDVEALGILHCPAHDAGVHHWFAVVGNCHDARLLHGSDAGEFLAHAAFGDGSDGEHVDRIQLTGAFQNIACHHRAVIHRIGVGHATDAGESTGGGGVSAGFNGLGMLEPRLA